MSRPPRWPGHKPGARRMVRGMTYAYAVKALPQDEDDEEEGNPFAKKKKDEEPDAGEELGIGPAPGPAEQDEVAPLAEEPPAPDGPPLEGPTDDSRRWAGDPYDEGDESDPSAAYAAFSGAGGEEAWLDRAGDGTLTGWLRDETGQVYRYTDADTWATDVDDAQMQRTGGGAEEEPAPDGEGEDEGPGMFPMDPSGEEGQAR